MSAHIFLNLLNAFRNKFNKFHNKGARKLLYDIKVDCRVVYSQLQLSWRWPCHIWLVARMKFASLMVNLDGGSGPLYPIFLYYLSLSLSLSLWEESRHD